MKYHHLHIWELCIFLLARRLWDGIVAFCLVRLARMSTFDVFLPCRSCILFTRTLDS
jgi:hypothetical protein